MRTERQMHDLVIAKVAAHRRRRALVVSSCSALLVVGLTAAVLGATRIDGPDDGVHVGPGPAPTTEAPTPSTADPVPSTTDTTPETEPAQTTAPPVTDPPVTDPPPETEPSPTTDPPATEPTTPAEPTVIERSGTDGDLSVTVTFTTHPARPGVVTIRVRATDPTGYDAHEWGGYGIGGSARVDMERQLFGDGPASCNGHQDPPPIETRPAELDEILELEHGPGSHDVKVRVYSNLCHEIGVVDIVQTVVFP